MAEHKAMFRVDAELYRKYPEIFETVEWRLKQELAEKMFDELEDGKSRIVTLGPTNRMEDEGLYAVRYIKGVKIESLVRCQECKHHRDLQYHYCTKWGKVCPDDSEFFCAWGERKEGGQDEC